MNAATPLFQITIDEKLLRELAKAEVARMLAEQGAGIWWDLKRLEAETCRKRDWLLDNILLNPRYKVEMARITNSCEGGRWMIRAAEMKQFLDRNFHQLNRRRSS